MESTITTNSIDSMRSCVRSVQSEYDRCAKALSKIDLVEQDILHFVEFETCDAATGYHIFAMLKEVRQKRREVKDKMEVLQMTRSLLQKAGLFDSKTWKAIDQRQEQTKFYRYRVISKDIIRGAQPWTL